MYVCVRALMKNYSILSSMLAIPNLLYYMYGVLYFLTYLIHTLALSIYIYVYLYTYIYGRYILIFDVKIKQHWDNTTASDNRTVLRINCKIAANDIWILYIQTYSITHICGKWKPIVFIEL